MPGKKKRSSKRSAARKRKSAKPNRTTLGVVLGVAALFVASLISPQVGAGIFLILIVVLPVALLRALLRLVCVKRPSHEIRFETRAASRFGRFRKRGDDADRLDGELAGEDAALPDDPLGRSRPSKSSFATVGEFRERLAGVRQRQRQMVREKKACAFPDRMTVDRSLSEGQKIVDDWVRLTLRAFDGECEAIFSKAKPDNAALLEGRIRKSAEEISNLGKRMRVSVRPEYVRLKIDEARLLCEYEAFQRREKERAQAIREEEREKAKVERELEERRAKIQKDQLHVANERASLADRLNTATAEETSAIREQIERLDEYAARLESDLEEVAFREKQARAGYVYVISNVGSFGENVYKIGMTRRLDPQERVDELGDASVPFRFDVHAFIFSEDAVALEAALHRRFDDKRVNGVNLRKEFFRVTLDEIEEEVRANYSEVVEFTRTAAAEEYRETLALRRRTA